MYAFVYPPFDQMLQKLRNAMRGRRTQIIVGLCGVLLIGYGVSYFLSPKKVPDNLRSDISARGTVIQVVGNTIVVRVNGLDQDSPDDDRARTFAIGDDTLVRMASESGEFALADPTNLRTIGVQVVVHTTKQNSVGLEQLQTVDILYVPTQFDDSSNE